MVDVCEIDPEVSIIQLDGGPIIKYVCYNCENHANRQKKILNEGGNCPECGRPLSKVECMIPL
jgi:predicted amidophosphoribosyltransferase